MRLINKFLSLLFIVGCALSTQAQDSRAYSFSTDTSGKIDKDALGNTISFSNSTSIFAANATDQNSSIKELPFDIVLLGKVYHNYLIGSSGYIALGNTGVITEPFLFPNSAGNSFLLGASNNYINQGVIAPFWDLQQVVSVNEVVTGTAPNRCLVVEWNTILPANSNGSPNQTCRYQARIYEASGTIEYVYSKIEIAPNTNTNVTATIGISRSSALGNFTFKALTDIDSFGIADQSFQYTNSIDELINSSDSGVVQELSGSTDSTCRRFLFEPNAMSAPGNLRAFNIRQDSALIYWDDNSSDELKFELYKADRNGVFHLDQVLNKNLNYVQLDGLLPSKIYQYKVRGYNQGDYSEFSNVLTFKTLAPRAVVALKSGDWSDTATWGGFIPSGFDSVVIDNGYTVTLDVNNAECYDLVALNGSFLFKDSTIQNSISIGNNLVIDVNGNVRVPQASVYSNLSHAIYLRGNLTNNGLLKLYDTSNSINQVGAKLVFYNIGYSEFTGTSLTNDLYSIEVSRSGLTDSVRVFPNNLSIKGSNIDAISGSGFLKSSTMVGVIEFAGNFKLQSRLFDVQGPNIPSLGSIIINNDSIEIIGLNADYQIDGGLHIKKGTFHAGLNSDNNFGGAFSLIVEGGEFTNSGTLYSTNAKKFVQSGGVIRLATKGNTSLTPSFGLSSSSTQVELTGGALFLTEGGSLPNSIDYLVNGDADLSNFRGGQVILQNSTGSNQFRIEGNFPNLNIDSSSQSSNYVQVELTGATQVYGTIDLGLHNSMSINDESLTLYGDSLFIEGKIYDATGDGKVVFKGDEQSLYGDGMVQVPELEFLLESESSTFKILKDSTFFGSRLGLVRGQIENTQWVQLGDSLGYVSINMGSNDGIYPGAVIDSFPAILNSIAGVYLSYINLDKDLISGFEIPQNRQLERLIFNTDSKIKIAGSALSVNDHLALIKGIVSTDTLNTIVLLSPNSSSLYVHSGSYIEGPFSRKIASNLSGGVNYLFPIGTDELRSIELENLHSGNGEALLTAEYKADALSYGSGYKITSIDSSFGYWYIKADSNANDINSFDLTIDYKLTDGFVRLAGGKSPDRSLSQAVVLDSIGTKLNNISTELFASGISLDSVNPVFYTVPAEYLGDTLFSADYKIGFGWDYENLTELSKKLNSSFVAEDLVFSITDEYDPSTEQFPIFFDQMRYAGGMHHVKVQLDSGVFGVVTSNGTKQLDSDYGMIAFFGADNLEFDGNGRDFLGVPTDTREWTFRTDNNSSSSSVFRFENDAQHSKLNGLNIISSYGTGSLNAAITIGGTHENWAGNDNLEFTNCYITADLGVIVNNGIINNGSNALNDFILIDKCEFENFASNYIYTYSNTGKGWKITNSHFYKSSSSLNGYMVNPLQLADGGASSMEISFNYFGGSEKFAAGNNWIYSGNTSNIYFNTFNASLDDKSVVRGNVFKNYYQSTLGSNYPRLFYFESGQWELSGNAFGSSSFTDGINVNSYRTAAMVYTPNNSNIMLSVLDNEFSHIRQPGNNTSTSRALRVLELYGNLEARVERNKMHDFEIYSRNRSSLQNGAFVAIYLNGSSDSYVIKDNEISNLYNRYNSYSYNSAIGIQQGGGLIEGNKIFDFDYSSTSGTLGYVAGIHINGSGQWIVKNNSILLDNASIPNAVVSMQGIRYYSTSATPSQFLHNTIVLRGQTRNTNSYGFVCGSYSYNLVLKNNLIINDNEMNNGNAYALHAQSVLTGMESDFNHYYTRDTARVIYDQNFGAVHSLDSWRVQSGMDMNSSIGEIPVFVSTTDLRLTSDTINWRFKAVGSAQPLVTTDIEGDARHAGQPDLGADEFVAPLFDEPIYVSGNDTLCAGNTRTLVVSNPNTLGEILWFKSISDFDTLHIGASFSTNPILHDTTFYVAVADSLMRSHRKPIHIKVVPLLTSGILNTPLDSLCAGASIDLRADSAQYNTSEWFLTQSSLTPVHTGTMFNLSNLVQDTMVYFEYVYNDGVNTCRSTRDSVEILVSQVSASSQTLSDKTICEGESVEWKINGPDQLKVFADPFTTQTLSVDTLFQTPILGVGTKNYFYEVFNGSCSGDRQSVEVDVINIPQTPQIDSLVYACYDEDIQLTSQGTGTLNWYTDDTTSQVFHTGALTLLNLKSDTTLFCSESNSTCESARIKVEVKVKNITVPGIIAAQTPICNNASSQIVAIANQGVQIEWYADSQMDTLLFQGASLQTNNLTQSKWIYVVGNDGQCYSELDSIQIQVLPVPTVPVITPVSTVCQGTQANVTANSNGTILWSSSMNGAVLGSGSNFLTPALNGNSKFFARTELSGCYSNFTQVSVPVIARPEPATVANAPEACRNSSVTIELNSSLNIEWFINSGTKTPIASGTQFTTPSLAVNTTYYFETIDGQCRSARKSVSIPVRNLPAAPTLSAVVPFCWGEEVTAFADAGNAVVRWYSHDTSSSPFMVDNQIYLGKMYSDTLFYVEPYDGHCVGNKIQYPIQVIDYLNGLSLTIPDSVLLGDQADISVSGKDNNLYSWSFGNNASISSATGKGVHSITWDKPGIKKVNLIVRKSQGTVTCDTIISKNVKVYEPGNPSSTTQLFDESDLLIYPNPARTTLNLEYTLKVSQDINISILDGTGKMVWKTSTDGSSERNSIQVNVEDLSSGLYIITVCGEKGACINRKVIIE